MIYATFLTNPGADALIVVLVVLLFFGPKRLGPLGRSLGEGMKEFKDSITGKSGSDDEDAERPAVGETSGPDAPSAPGPAPPAPAANAEPEPEAGAPTEAPPVASSERRS